MICPLRETAFGVLTCSWGARRNDQPWPRVGETSLNRRWNRRPIVTTIALIFLAPKLLGLLI